jgi:hypothetical protein
MVQFGFGEVGIMQICTPQVGVAQVGSTEVCIMQICTPQIGLRQPRVAQIGASLQLHLLPQQ